MSDQRLEDFHIERFLVAAGISPDEKPQPSESPDCLLRLAGRLIGLEHTEFFLPSKAGEISPKQHNSYQELCVEHARQVFRKSGGPALYVYPIFNTHRVPRTKQDAYDVGKRLAELVALNGWPQSPYLQRFKDWRKLPEFDSYFVMSSLDGQDELWHSGGGGMVQTVEPKHIQACLDEKAPLYARYLQSTPVVWLLIVNDMFRGGTPCKIGIEASMEYYTTPFDRIFWFESMTEDVTELQVMAG
jgi:hypothetical protein